MPRSGSTLTDLMLHQLPGHIGVGELFYLWRNGLAHEGLCACWRDLLAVRLLGRGRPGRVRRLVGDGRRARHSPPGLGRPHLENSWLLSPGGHGPSRPSSRSTPRSCGGSTRPSAACRAPRSWWTPRSGHPSPTSSRRCRTWTCGSSRWSGTRRGVAFSFNKHVALPDGAALRNEMPRSTTRKVSRRWVTVNSMIAALRPFGCAADPGALRGPRRPIPRVSWRRCCS